MPTILKTIGLLAALLLLVALVVYIAFVIMEAATRPDYGIMIEQELSKPGYIVISTETAVEVPR